MYRVGIVINENEVSHSKYADTFGALKLSIDKCNQNGNKGNSYHFIVFDKFNIHDLFNSSEINIKTLDGIFVATNAMSFNQKIHNVFCENKQSVERFLNRNKGIFISSQKKLSNKSLSNKNYSSIGFLPEKFDYYTFYRPEKYSSEGYIRISEQNKILMYPYKITSEIIKNHCENNQFIVHKYRSLIIPKHHNAYATLLCDDISVPISHKELGYINSDRKVLLSSRFNMRIVISTMAVDWANHEELLCNILTFITEDRPRTFFVRKKHSQPKNTIIDSYILRANIANIPYRVISENEINICTKTSGNAFIFSPNWLSEEIETIYSSLIIKQTEYFSLHHICEINNASNKNYKLTKYRNFSSIDLMKDAVVQNLLSCFLSNSWNRSVWTYSYILRIIEFFEFDIHVIVKKVFQELSLHFTKKDHTTGKVALIGNYDNVFNATCKLLEILNYFKINYFKTISDDSPYDIENVINLAETWMFMKIESESVFDQDICYVLLYLFKSNKYDVLDRDKKFKLTQLFSQLLTRIIEELMSMRIESRSSIDLCRVYQTLCMSTKHNIFPKEKTNTYLNKIETILNERQDVYGNWKNISETAEIAVMLLETYNIRSNIDLSMEIANTLITKGIRNLYSQYNQQTSMWSNDINSTAKAMYAIGIYDNIFNYAINDFFSELKNHQNMKVELTEDTNIYKVGEFYQTIDTLEQKNEELNKKIITDENSISSLKKKLSNTKYISFALFAVIISLLFIVILIIAILYINHNEIFLMIVGDWKSHFIEGFIGFAISAILTALIIKFKKILNE